MENKKFWWFTKKNEPAEDFDDYNNGYYGDEFSQAKQPAEGYDSYNDAEGDVSVVLSGDPSKKEPVLKRTFTPDDCNDSAEIVDAFKLGRVIVICVENLDKANFLRLFDYLMGAVQALDGELRRIDRETVVLLPYDFDEDETPIDSLEEEEVEETDAEDLDD